MGIAREALKASAILMLTAGLVLLGFGFILRETRLFGLVFLVAGAYLALHGALILLEAWIGGRS